MRVIRDPGADQIHTTLEAVLAADLGLRAREADIRAVLERGELYHGGGATAGFSLLLDVTLTAEEDAAITRAWMQLDGSRAAARAYREARRGAWEAARARALADAPAPALWAAA